MAASRARDLDGRMVSYRLSFLKTSDSHGSETRTTRATTATFKRAPASLPRAEHRVALWDSRVTHYSLPPGAYILFPVVHLQTLSSASLLSSFEHGHKRFDMPGLPYIYSIFYCLF